MSEQTDSIARQSEPVAQLGTDQARYLDDYIQKLESGEMLASRDRNRQAYQERQKVLIQQFYCDVAETLVQLKTSDMHSRCVRYSITYLYEHSVIKQMITELVARGHYVTHWRHPQVPANTEEFFELEIFKLGYHKAGTGNRLMVKYLMCNLL